MILNVITIILILIFLYVLFVNRGTVLLKDNIFDSPIRVFETIANTGSLAYPARRDLVSRGDMGRFDGWYDDDGALAMSDISTLDRLEDFTPMTRPNIQTD